MTNVSHEWHQRCKEYGSGVVGVKSYLTLVVMIVVRDVAGSISHQKGDGLHEVGCDYGNR